MNYTPGQLLWSERDPTASQFFIIREGTASVKDGGTGVVWCDVRCEVCKKV